MDHQECTISSIEHFTFKSNRIVGNILYFSVELTTTKMFHLGKLFHTSIEAKIYYIVHTVDDTMQLLNDLPYRRVVNKQVKNSIMGIERYSDGWRFKNFVEVPSNFKSFGVGRTVLNILLKKAKEIAPDASMTDKLQGGSAEQHAIRDSFYKNIGFIYEGHYFKIDRIDNLKTFETIENIEEVDLRQELLSLSFSNENLTIALATANEKVNKKQTEDNYVRNKYNWCHSQKMCFLLAVSIFALIYILLIII